MCRVLLRMALVCGCCYSQARVVADDQFFETRIRPVLVERCAKCHGSQKASSGLRVDSLEALRKGGERGPAVVPGDPQQSLLIHALSHNDDDLQMPPDKALPEFIVEDFHTWIRNGAPWPESLDPDSPLGGSGNHWALEPVRPLQPPLTEQAWAWTPVDRFVAAKREQQGLEPVSDADKRTLIRRAYFDLVGLPPAPEDVIAFLADTSPTAFARLVDRLLASPHYGERWGRHWLDVVRYADTAGEGGDFPVPQAYRYRDYVIAAFNSDKPYDQFIREQIAGDLLEKGVPHEQYTERVIATGYLAVTRRFGWNRLSEYHVTLGECIDTIGQSLMGLTLGCARCHDHKYDPISMSDYYALYGILESTTFAYPGSEDEKKPENNIPLIPADEVEKILATHEAKILGPEADLRRLEDETARLKGKMAVLEGNGSATLSIEAGKLLFAGVKTKIAVVSDVVYRDVSVALEAQSDSEAGIVLRYGDSKNFLLANYRPAGPDIYFHEVESGGYGAMVDVVKTPDLALSIRLTATVKDDQVKFTVSDGQKTYSTQRKLTKITRAGSVGVFQNSSVPQSLESFTVVSDSNPIFEDSFDDDLATRNRWQLGAGVWRADLLSSSDKKDGGQLQQSAVLQQELERLETSLAEARKQVEERKTTIAAIPSAYAVSEGSPQDSQIHQRGDPKKLGRQVPRRFLEMLGGDRVSPGDGSGRLQLADWITRESNPLPARVMVNRIWQYHFGRGIVNTPNNFGFRGQPPVNPDLLEYLAWRLRQTEWSVKSMHRMMMLSRTYQLSGEYQEDGTESDPNNEFHWRYTERRLDAEAIRDAMLVVSGELVRDRGGPHPFPPPQKWAYSQHTPFRPDHADYETLGRSVYLMIQRNRRNPFLELFDCADPRTTTPQRSVSTTPSQALYFMNHPFIRARAESFAIRLMAEMGEESERIKRAYQLAFGRLPDLGETTAAYDYLNEYRRHLVELGTSELDATAKAWTSQARILFSSNEFIHVQ